MILILLIALYVLPHLCIGFTHTMILLAVSFLPDTTLLSYGLGWLARLRSILSFDIPQLDSRFPIGLYPLALVIGYDVAALMVGMMGVVAMPPLLDVFDVSFNYIIGSTIAIVIYRILFWPLEN